MMVILLSFLELTVPIMVPILNISAIFVLNSRYHSPMKLSILSSFMYFLLISACLGQSPADSITERYKEYLFTSQKIPEQINPLTTAIQTNDTGLPEQSEVSPKAKAIVNFHLLRDLSMVWSNPKSSAYKNGSVKVAID